MIEYKSTISCPGCSTSFQEIMPKNACLFFYECLACKIVFKPKKGDCCVFCSYGTVPCPPIQEVGGNNCC